MSVWGVAAVSLLFSAVGFLRYHYFFSLGYGLSVAAIGAALAIAFRGRLGAWGAAACGLLALYGVRLAGYLLLRELRSASYRETLAPELARSRAMPLGPKLALWVCCGLMYALQTLPVYFRLRNGVAPDGLAAAGLVVMACGIALEAAADLQKALAKRRAPGTFVSGGLFGFVRCPNYLGELILWLGVLLSAATGLRGFVQWGLSLAGYLLLCYVMFSGARRLEIRQQRRYGGDPAYRNYAMNTPILLPFVPLYSLEGVEWLRG